MKNILKTAITVILLSSIVDPASACVGKEWHGEKLRVKNACGHKVIAQIDTYGRGNCKNYGCSKTLEDKASQFVYVGSGVNGADIVYCEFEKWKRGECKLRRK